MIRARKVYNFKEKVTEEIKIPPWYWTSSTDESSSLYQEMPYATFMEPEYSPLYSEQSAIITNA
jgi:hypothetical protein